MQCAGTSMAMWALVVFVRYRISFRQNDFWHLRGIMVE